MQVARHTRPEGHFKVGVGCNYIFPGAVTIYSQDRNRVLPPPPYITQTTGAKCMVSLCFKCHLSLILWQQWLVSCFVTSL